MRRAPRITAHCLSVALLSAQLAGCSLVFVKPAPAGAFRRITEPRCTQSVAAPVVDTVVAGAAGAGAVSGLTTPKCDHLGCIGSSVARLGGLVLLVPTAIYAVSALYGYEQTAKCRALIERIHEQAPDRMVARDRPSASVSIAPWFGPHDNAAGFVVGARL